MKTYRIVKDNSGRKKMYRLQRKIFGLWFYYWDYVQNEALQEMEYVHRRFFRKEDVLSFIEKKDKVITIQFEII